MQMRNRLYAEIFTVLLLTVVAGGLLVNCFRENEKDQREEAFFDSAAVEGTLPGISEQEIQAELDQIVEEGMLNISIASGIRFEDGDSEGKANIYNTEANQYIFKVAIKLDDTGETVYQSKGIKPGQYISYIRLAKKLDAGEYAATATFTAYTQDTHQVVGSTGAQLTLYVGSV